MNGDRAVLLWECFDPLQETALVYLKQYEQRWGSERILVARKPHQYGTFVRIYRIESRN